MQTFLPYRNFAASAAVLDRQRLGKQRVEAKQIMRTLLGESAGWQNHPAVRMWRGHEYSLAQYGMLVCVEWQGRGYRDTLLPYFVELYHALAGINTFPPTWKSNSRLYASHRSNLLRKDPEHYGQFGWLEPPDLPYFWPV